MCRELTDVSERAYTVYICVLIISAYWKRGWCQARSTTKHILSAGPQREYLLFLIKENPLLVSGCQTSFELAFISDMMCEMTCSMPDLDNDISFMVKFWKVALRKKVSQSCRKEGWIFGSAHLQGCWTQGTGEDVSGRLSDKLTPMSLFKIWI